jgi:kynurenine formamidase
VDEIRKVVSEAKVSLRDSIVLLYTGWEDAWRTDVYLKNLGYPRIVPNIWSGKK